MSVKHIVEDLFGIKRVGNSLIVNGNLVAFNLPGDSRFVSRNKGSVSGNGKSWAQAFLTITEGIDWLNAAYTAQRRVRALFIEEGFYAELPMTLTASDCFIHSVAPGHHYNTVLYSVPVAGVFSGTAGGPGLAVTGSNVTISNMGFFVSDPIYPCVRLGNNASNPDGAAVSTVFGVAIKNCSFVRDVQNGSRSGIQSYGGDFILIEDCSFSTSQDQYGIEVLTNGVINPVNHIIRRNQFVGTEVGILNGPTAHNTLIQDNHFRDDTTDRPDTITTAVDNQGSATSTVCTGNYWAFSDADAVITNAAFMKGNFQLASA